MEAGGKPGLGKARSQSHSGIQQRGPGNGAFRLVPKIINQALLAEEGMVVAAPHSTCPQPGGGRPAGRDEPNKTHGGTSLSLQAWMRKQGEQCWLLIPALPLTGRMSLGKSLFLLEQTCFIRRREVITFKAFSNSSQRNLGCSKMFLGTIAQPERMNDEWRNFRHS